MSYREILQQAESFHLLSDEALSTIEAFCDLRQFQRGDRLFKEGETAHSLWVITEGAVDLRFDLPGRETTGESTLSSVAANRIIGWSSLIRPYQYKLSAYCNTDQCRMLLMDREKLLDYLYENPKTGYCFFSAMLRLVGSRFETLQHSAGDRSPILDTADARMLSHAKESIVSCEFLQQTDIFKNFTDSELAAIRSYAEVLEFKKDDRIFAQGDRAAHVWIVREGKVRLQTDSERHAIADGKPLVSFMAQAQAFGWTCFVPPYEYRLSGYCDSRWCTLIRLDRDDLARIFEEEPVIGFQVMAYLLAVVGTQFMQYQEAIARKRGIEMMSQW